MKVPKVSYDLAIGVITGLLGSILLLIIGIFISHLGVLETAVIFTLIVCVSCILWLVLAVRRLQANTIDDIYIRSNFKGTRDIIEKIQDDFKMLAQEIRTLSTQTSISSQLSNQALTQLQRLQDELREKLANFTQKSQASLEEVNSIIRNLATIVQQSENSDYDNELPE